MKVCLLALLSAQLLSLSACAAPGSSFDVAASKHFQHVVIVVQENRSFDNLFHGYPGADTVDVGLAHDGTHVSLQPVSFTARYDISNNVRDFQDSYDKGKMDGFDLRSVGPQPGAKVPLAAAQYPEYAFVPPQEAEPYFEIARRFVLADRMFQSNIDQSFAAHLYLIAGQANRTADVPSGRPWGCDAGPQARVPTLRDDRRLGARIFPCFDLPTLADELDAAGLSWAYYAPKVESNLTWRALARHRTRYIHEARLDAGQLWSSFDVIPRYRFGPSWQSNVISPSAQFLNDIEAGRLRNVSWVVPDYKNSDHAGSESASGPSWVSSIVNAVGHSKYWQNTAILITWDDAGGWYDHVPPRRVDYDGLGLRVPLLVVSSYSKRGFVSHREYEFGSLLRFSESVFGLRSLSQSDARANNLEDCFNFSAPPQPFNAIPASLGPPYFKMQRPSPKPPDDN